MNENDKIKMVNFWKNKKISEKKRKIFFTKNNFLHWLVLTSIKIVSSDEFFFLKLSVGYLSAGFFFISLGFFVVFTVCLIYKFLFGLFFVFEKCFPLVFPETA